MAGKIGSAEQLGSFFKALELGESALRARHLHMPALLTPMRALLTADTCACELYLLLCHALVQEEAARGEARRQREERRGSSDISSEIRSEIHREIRSETSCEEAREAAREASR